MKRKITILAFAFVATLTSYAQTTKTVSTFKPARVPAAVANKAVPLEFRNYDASQTNIPAPAQQDISLQDQRDRVIPTASQKIRGVTDFTIGNTYYDLQTNASVRNALVKNPDGSLAAVWTFGPTSISGWPTRGTGYNYFDGSAWGPIPTTTIEPPRTGWPNVVNLANGKEVTLSHNTTVGQLDLTSRDVKGTGAWTSTTTELTSPITGGNWWPRMISGGTDGNSIHILSITYPVANGGSLYNDMDGALLYSRSTDGGTTWDKINEDIPGIDATEFTGITGDDYAIDARGKVIAMVAGGFTNDVVMLKSLDNGDTWTKTVIYQFPIPLYQNGAVTDINGDGEADTLDTTDGAFSILIDNNDMVHIWMGAMRVINDGSFASVAYFPGTDGLMYWNESMPTGALPPLIAAAPDLDDDGILNVAAIGTFNQGLCSWPSSGIDAAGNIYLSYGTILETTDANANIDGDGKNIRHSFVMVSPDGGATWTYDKAIDIVTDEFSEGVWASMARDVDSKVHLVYQRDFCTGFGVPASDGSIADPCNTGQLNDIVYVEVDASDLVGIVPTTVASDEFSVYPNPSTGSLTLSTGAISHGSVDLMVLNSLGQTVKFLNHQNVVAGHVNVDVSDLANGLYLLHISPASGGTASVPFNISR